MAQARKRSIGPEVSERAGRRVRRLRTERGLSHQDLSLLIHDETKDDPDGQKEMTAIVLRNLEYGVLLPDGTRQPRRVELGEAAVLARVFGVTIDYLAGLEERE
jgi:transcriptional regulator with XRE-family HTH domain